MSRTLALSALLLLAQSLSAADWPQWGRSPAHESQSDAAGQPLGRIVTTAVVDPFAEAEIEASGDDLLVHYQVPLLDGDDVFLPLKGGTYDSADWTKQTWSVRNLRWSGSSLVTRWTFTSDWKPVPRGGPQWEPVFHCAVDGNVVWVPGGGGTMLKVDRDGGTRVATFNPFGTAIDPDIYVTGPPTVDAQGSVFYNTIKLAPAGPWSNDTVDSWLVKIAPDGTIRKVSFSALVPNAPAAASQCTTSFGYAKLPFPPSPTATAPTITCGSQRPGINVAPAVAADGTVYTVSRAHFAGRWGFLIAATSDLTPKWASTLHGRFDDGCNVVLPPTGTLGGCRAGAQNGVDPSDNQPGSGTVLDESTSSPVVTPDGKVLYGAFTRYNYGQGHLMMFDANGTYAGAYGWGWDLTPSIWRHDGTYSILLKENHYSAGSYCDIGLICPGDRSRATPSDPEQYFITQLSPQLQREWRFRSTNAMSCSRSADGTVSCVADHPDGFEWCVNAIAVDSRGVVYANSEDGNLYAINQGGLLREHIFLREALGAAYTPLSIGRDGRIYTQNAGDVFVVGATSRRRIAGQ